MYICDFSRSVGVGSAMCLKTRGLVRSVIRRIVPPLPAESSPSKTMHTLAPEDLTHSCMATSSPWRRRISFSYFFRFILGLAVASVDVSASAFLAFLLIRHVPRRRSRTPRHVGG